MIYSGKRVNDTIRKPKRQTRTTPHETATADVLKDALRLQANVIYKADVTTTDNNETKTHIGVAANNFKT